MRGEGRGRKEKSADIWGELPAFHKKESYPWKSGQGIGFEKWGAPRVITQKSSPAGFLRQVHTWYKKKKKKRKVCIVYKRINTRRRYH